MSIKKKLKSRIALFGLIVFLGILNFLPVVLGENAAPITTTPYILYRSFPTYSDDLNCTFTMLDPDGQTDLIANITWFKNDVGYLNYTMNVYGSNYTSTTLDKGNTSAGEKWICRVIPYDTIDYGIGKNSSAITIQDTTAPSISITYPESISYSINVSALNYTYSDNNPDSCWYSTNSGLTNSTKVSAGTNFTGIISITGSNTWTLYCNDSLGNKNSTSVTFFKSAISNCTELQAMLNDKAGNYVLTNNIDCSDTINWNSGEGFTPIGTYDSGGFTGTFNGQGNIITDLFINETGGTDVGFFGRCAGKIENVGLENLYVRGYERVGGIAGSSGGSNCIINNSYVSGNVVSGYDYGGLIVGVDWSETISNVYSTGSVTGNVHLGGISGTIASADTWNNVYSTASVTGNDITGALVGINYGQTCDTCYWNAYLSRKSTGGTNGGFGTELSNIEMLNQSSYVDWDFTNIWDIQTNSTPYLKFTATPFFPNFPFVNTSISNCTELQAMENDLTANYTLMNNIDCSDTINWNNGEGFTPIGTYENEFRGTFDGQGNIITDLFINRSASIFSQYQGLFGYTLNSEIKNIGLINVNITGNNYVGGIAGSSGGSNCIINNSYVSGNVVSYNDYGGLIVGISWSETISNVYSTGSVTGNIHLGGISGTIQDATWNNVYSTAKITGNSDTGALVGYNAGTCTNSYWNKYLSGQETSACGTELSNSEMLNQASYTDWDFTNVWDIQTGSTPYLRFNPIPFFPNITAPSISITYPESISYSINVSALNYTYSDNNPDSCWYSTDDGLTNSTEVSAGINFTDIISITGNNTWTLYCNDTLGNENSTSVTFFKSAISNCTELQAIENDLTANYTLMNNIDCSDTINWNSGQGFIPIGNDGTNFEGSLDGQGYNITDLFINRSASNYQGLFGYSTGKIQNVGLINVNVTGSYAIGGLVGQNNGTISNSYSTGNINGNNGIGGLVGENYGTIKNSYAEGNVIGSGSIGGLVGDNYGDGKINNSYSTANVTASGDGVGGLIGYNIGIIDNSYGIGNVTGGSSAGGLVGFNDGGNVTNSYSAGSITGTTDIGGLIGGGYLGTCTNSYWNAYLSGQETSACGTELSNSEMLNQASYTDWDFTNVWDIQTGSTPYLRFTATPFFPEFPAEEILILSVSYETPVTLNGGTTKDIYILFDTSSSSVNDTSAQVIITNGLESRTSSSCSNISTQFNCTITMQFYDSAGSWNINASIQDNSENWVENSSESFVVNALDYVTQNINYVEWTSLNPNTNDNEASNTITFTNGGNQDYPTCNIKAYDVVGDIYLDMINANQFSIDNETGKTTGQIYLQNDTNIDVSSTINLNTHSSSSTTTSYFYADVPSGIRADIYHQINSWEISFS